MQVRCYREFDRKGEKMSDVVKFFQIKDENGNVTQVLPIGAESSNVSVGLKTLDDVLAEQVEMADLASEFEQSREYLIGEYVTYDNKLYRITAKHNSGTAWSGTAKQEVKLAEDLEDWIQISDTQPASAANKIWIDKDDTSGVQIPSYNQFLGLRGTIAKDFDVTKAYTAGTKIYYDNKLYRLTADHDKNVSWVNTSKEEISLVQIIDELYLAIQKTNE